MIQLNIPEGIHFHWRGLKKWFLQFKTLRRVIYIPQEGFRYIELKSYYELLTQIFMT